MEIDFSSPLQTFWRADSAPRPSQVEYDLTGQTTDASADLSR